VLQSVQEYESERLELMEEYGPVIGIVVLLAAALVGGMIAHRMRQPVILGYLVVGVAVGPHALGLVGDLVLVEAAATMGVALLMFTLGLEVSISQLRMVGRVGLWGGTAQILGTFGLGMLLGLTLFGWPLLQALVFGLVLSLSSTMVSLKILMERGELDSVHGRIMVAMLVLQDISVVLMVIIMPFLGGSVENIALEIVIAVGKAVLFIGAAIVLGLWILPWLLGRVGGVRSRELFLLTIIVLSLGAALSTYIFGLSVVFGAFVIGLVLRESKFGHRALAEITPLRDMFAALFFVSLGMLMDPAFVAAHWPQIILTVAVIMGLKFLVVFGIVRAFKYNNRIAVLTGGGLLQIGEFSFILAQAGVNMEIITPDFYSLILASALITMMLTPFSSSGFSWLCARIIRRSRKGMDAPDEDYPHPAEELAKGRKLVTIAGYGRVGENIAIGLREAGIPCSVIEIDPELISRMRCDNMVCIYGDANNFHVLEQASIRRAKILVVTFPDPVAVLTTVRIALRLNPKIKIMARVHRTKEAEQLQKLGVKELISPEYEASFRLLKRVLNISRVGKDERKRVLEKMRQQEEIIDTNGDDY
jgi:K+:H+ antiporter